MSTKTDRVDEDVDGIRKLAGEIAKEQQKIDRHEGNVVACHVRIAARLAALRSLAKKTWGKQLKALGISPRVASRYLKIARCWPSEIGLNESDLLTRLPTDLLKLEWLCRVPVSQLGELLESLNCKKATRPQVVAAVRELLGEDPPATTDAVETYVQRLVQRLMGTVEKLWETFPEPEQHNRARQLLAAGLVQVQDALQHNLIAEGQAAAAVERPNENEGEVGQRSNRPNRQTARLRSRPAGEIAVGPETGSA